MKKFVILSALVIAGCGSGSGGDKKLSDVVNNDVSQYSYASCLYKYDEGPLASPLLSSDVRTSYFGKKIDHALLSPVLRASGSEVVRFAENTGVSFYKVEASAVGSCGFAAVLPDAKPDLNAEFKKFSKDSNILGLYLGQNTPDLVSTQNSAAIIVRKDVNKWVLVHEYLHHLFHKQLVLEGGSEDIKSEFKAVATEYDLVKEKSKNASGAEAKELTSKTAKLLAQMSDKFLEVMRQYYLEEMTIESLLAEEFNSGRLTLVVEGQRINGAAYTVVSAKKTEKLIEAVEREIYYFKLLNSYTLDSSDQRALQASESQLSAIKSDISRLYSKADSYLNQKLGYGYQRGLGLSGLHAEYENHSGCSHGQAADDVAEVIENLSR